MLACDSGSTAIIAAGTHTYPFSFHIPTHCPSSFKGLYGSIRYLIRISLIRPWKFDQSFTKGFTVLKIMDLNLDGPTLSAPVYYQVEKVFCCGPCKTDPLKLHVSLPYRGYVPGQNIPVNVLITNDSSIPVIRVLITLLMKVQYYSTFPSTNGESQCIPLSKLIGEGVPRHCKKQFTYHLAVPATPPTCFNLCSIIKIDYLVQVLSEVKGCHLNQAVHAAVTIGNVPLANVIQQQPRPRSNVPNIISLGVVETRQSPIEQKVESTTAEAGTSGEATAKGNPDPPAYAQPWAIDESISPPSYEEAVHIGSMQLNATDGHDYGESSFTPRYPVFHIPSPSAPIQDETAVVT